MLSTKIFCIKIPNYLRLYLFFTLPEKFIILHFIEKNKQFYVQIPDLIFISKKNNYIFINTVSSKTKNYFFFKNFVNKIKLLFQTLKIINCKKLILNGLGLKVILENSSLKFKLGFSHETKLFFNLKDFTIKIKKLGLRSLLIVFYSFNKVKLGNLVEKIFRLKQALSLIHI